MSIVCWIEKKGQHFLHTQYSASNLNSYLRKVFFSSSRTIRHVLSSNHGAAAASNREIQGVGAYTGGVQERAGVNPNSMGGEGGFLHHFRKIITLLY